MSNYEDQPFPNLTTERFILRKIEPSDAGELFQYFSNDEVTRYYDLESFTQIEQALEIIERWNNRCIAGEGIRWGIALKENNKIIGSCGYHNWAKEHCKAEIGFEVTPQYWRQGVMTEVLRSVILYGFQQMGLHRIEALYDPDNIASKRTLEKAGFHYEGRMRECFFEKGQYVDAEICSLLVKDL